jgi:hypothetical protein
VNYEEFRVQVNGHLKEEHNIDLADIEKIIGEPKTKEVYESDETPDWAAVAVWELAVATGRLLQLRLVVVDWTEYWELDPEDMQYIDRIEQVYLYDKLERTFCCEVTPSRFLVPIETRPVFKEGVEDEGIKEKIYDIVQGSEDYEPMYVHTYEADRMKGEDIGYAIVEEGEEYRDVFDTMESYCRMNSLI